jgi:ribonuclease P protein component
VQARLSRAQRLTRRPEFDVVMKSGARTRDDCFNVCVLAQSTTPARLGITVAKRVSPRAVARNRIKRQIRESFRHHQQSLQGLSIVVTAQPAANAKDNAHLRASLHRLWGRVTQTCKRSPSQS